MQLTRKHGFSRIFIHDIQARRNVNRYRPAPPGNLLQVATMNTCLLLMCFSCGGNSYCHWRRPLLFVRFVKESLVVIYWEGGNTSCCFITWCHFWCMCSEECFFIFFCTVYGHASHVGLLWDDTACFPRNMYHKFPKYSDTQKICCNHPKIWTM